MKTLSPIESIRSSKGSFFLMVILYSLGTLLLAPPCLAAEWQQTGSLVTPRFEHTATLLKNGRVLVVGGYTVVQNALASLASAELYDPRRGTWRAGASM